MRILPQVRLIHLSDIHFGSKHICAPFDPSGSAAGVTRLEHLIEQDLSNAEWADSLWATARHNRSKTPLFIAATGDFAQTASPPEFARAHDFLTYLAGKPLLDTTVTSGNLFVVPGNHDVRFIDSTSEYRFQPYATFYNKLFERTRSAIQAHNATDFSQIHIRPDAGLAVAEVNSCLYVEKETQDESRGQVDLAAIAKLRNDLVSIRTTTADFIKIALIHHHPVLIPSLVEPGHGYDAVLNSGSLLRVLREHGFQLILHGHKHHPQVFSFDPESAWSSSEKIPQVIVAGGSCGSRELPPGAKSMNTYNVITVKWDPKVLQARIQIITRGLVRLDEEGPLDPDEWKWMTLRVIDRTVGANGMIPAPNVFVRTSKPKHEDADSLIRKEYYRGLRYNLPVAEVMPSLLPKQAYEVRVWLEQHHEHTEFPTRVTWSAGPWFERKVCDDSARPTFCAYFHYWGPTLIQVKLEFQDGHEFFGYVYARFPGALEEEGVISDIARDRRPEGK